MKHQLIENLEQRVLFSFTDPNAPKAYTMGNAGATAIFAQYDTAHGMELYRSDGTSKGTYMLKDIFAGSEGSNPNFLATLGNTVLFSAYDGHGYALWKTDGTVTGTVKTNGGSPNANYQGPNPTPARIGSVLFYISMDHKLWRTNGSNAGTYPLTDRFLDFFGPSPQKLAVLNGYVYFSADDGKHGFELWRSNGTVHGTGLFADVVPGPAASGPRNIVATSDRVYFVDDITGASKEHLWKTDGVSVKLVETSSSQFSGLFAGIYQLTPVDGTLYFTEDELGEIQGADTVWQVTAKANSLQRLGHFVLPIMVIKDPNTGPAKRAYFYGHGKVDGSAKNFFAVKDGKYTTIKTNLDPSVPTTVKQIADDLYFSVQTSRFTGSPELWFSEGGPARLIQSFPESGTIDGIAAFGSKVIFAASSGNAAIGRLYISDRTAAGTKLLSENDAWSDSAPAFASPILANGRLYLAVRQPDNLWALWVTDGTSAGTHVTREFT